MDYIYFKAGEPFEAMVDGGMRMVCGFALEMPDGFCSDVHKEMCDEDDTDLALMRAIASHAGIELCEGTVLPGPTRVLQSGRWTIVFWDDGDVTRIRASEEDEFRPAMGAVMCALRKALGRNGSYGRFYGAARAVSDCIGAVSGSGLDASEVELLRTAVGMALDAMECDGYDPGYDPDEVAVDHAGE